MKRFLLLMWALLLTASAQAHKPSDSYLSLNVQGASINGQWDIALRDLDFALGLDADGDAQITWGEVRAKHGEIAAYALARLTLSSQGNNCPLQMRQHLVDEHSDGAYAVLRFLAVCPQTVQTLGARYGLFFDIDPQHKGLLRLESDGQTRSAIFSHEHAKQEFILNQPKRMEQFLAYARAGVWHIWIGFDHILFLLALLLPAVVQRRARHWQAVDKFTPALWDVLKIVTAFTLAHSITLTLATLQVISLPSRWVEATIAASVVIAALNNIFPLFRERRWLMAFGFGLIHGFGFASVLSDLGLPQGALVLALVGFNLGVEAGQLAIVSGFLPLAFGLRRSWLYQRLVLVLGSLAIALLASIWLAERLFDFKVLGF